MLPRCKLEELNMLQIEKEDERGRSHTTHRAHTCICEFEQLYDLVGMPDRKNVHTSLNTSE